jgi:hypothetical protein
MFYIGQKVVCIDASPISTPSVNTPIYSLIKNKVYHVHDIKAFPASSRFYGDIALGVNKDRTGIDFWHSDRFKPLEEKKTDISIFTAMLNPVQKDVDKFVKAELYRNMQSAFKADIYGMIDKMKCAEAIKELQKYKYRKE